ncbi:MAG: helix-turn-helix transcriptional regulator [bacterium]|nr:helix-turn-helix transcriptional regulator [bacterium]
METDDLKAFSKRLIEVRKHLGYMQKDFAPLLEVSTSFLYQVEASRTKPGFHFIKKLVEKFDVNPKYLFTGKGKMLYDMEPEQPPEKDYGPYSDRVHEMLLLIEKSPQVKMAVLEYFNNYRFDHQALIADDIEKYRESLENLTKKARD